MAKKAPAKQSKKEKNPPQVGTSNLTHRKRLFCQLYLVHSGNGTKAAKESGYSEKGAAVHACRLLADPQIQRHIKYLQKKTAQKINVTIDSVAQEMAKIAFANIADFVRIGKDGKPKPLNLNRLTPAQKASIKRIKASGEVELHEKPRALEMLAKYLGMWKDGGLDAGDVGDLLSAAKQRMKESHENTKEKLETVREDAPGSPEKDEARVSQGAIWEDSDTTEQPEEAATSARIKLDS